MKPLITIKKTDDGIVITCTHCGESNVCPVGIDQIYNAIKMHNQFWQAHWRCYQDAMPKAN